MFTGIVEEVGTVLRVERRGGHCRLTVRASVVCEGQKVGDSVNIDGVCQTVVSRDRASFAVESVEETLTRTTLGDFKAGVRVNLERAVCVGGRLGGHLVLGHVDGVGEVVRVVELTGSRTVTIRAPGGAARYIVEKGSIAVDGVSLTVSAIQGDLFSVALIPHTLVSTTCESLHPGSRVNVEVDVLGKYVERLIGAVGPGKSSLTEGRLVELGFG